MSLEEHFTQKNIGLATGGAAVFATLIGTYVQFRGDPTPTENILDDVRAMQAGCQKDKDAWRDLLEDEALELKECRTEVRTYRKSEDAKFKELEDRITFLESSIQGGEVALHTETTGNLHDSNDGDGI